MTTDATAIDATATDAMTTNTTADATQAKPKTSVMRVVIYRAPSPHELGHWALITSNKNHQEMKFEVFGGDRGFDFSATNITSSSSFSTTETEQELSNFIITERDFSMEDVYEALSATEIDNSRKEFNCQSWIMKGLQNLVEFEVVTKEEYERVKGALEEAFDQYGWGFAQGFRGVSSTISWPGSSSFLKEG
jgi:hypothetical protein